MQRLWLYATLVLAAGPLASTAAAQARENPVTVRLEPTRGSGISGSVVLSANGRETDFAMTLNAADLAQRRQEFDVWLRIGTCVAPGRRVADIDDVRADGRTEHEDEDVALAELVRSDHILEVRVEDRDEVVACGTIPRRGSRS